MSNYKNQSNYNNQGNERKERHHIQKKDINKNAKFTLSLVDKLSDISFCDKQCSNVNDNVFKSKLLEFLDERYGINVIDRLFVNLNPNMFKNVCYHQHVLTTLTNGNPYLLFLTRIDGVNCCFYIDRKLKVGYNYPKIHCVKYQFSDELFDDTIFSGELVKDVQRRWFFLLSDILLYKGETMSNLNIVSRYEMMNKILLNDYMFNSNIEVCPLFIKKLFMYRDFEYMTQKYMPSLSYYCRGIIFNTLNTSFTNYAYIISRENQIKIINEDEIDEAVKIEDYDLWEKKNNINHTNNYTNNYTEKKIDALDIQNEEENIMIQNEEEIIFNNTLSKEHKIEANNVVFRVLSTHISDIYNLYCKSKTTNELTKYGIALVPNIKKSHYLAKLFEKEENNLNVCMECKYSKIFDAWEPVNQVSHNAYTESQVGKIENNLKKYN